MCTTLYFKVTFLFCYRDMKIWGCIIFGNLILSQISDNTLHRHETSYGTDLPYYPQNTWDTMKVSCRGT